jgi:hypothetical protein
LSPALPIPRRRAAVAAAFAVGSLLAASGSAVAAPPPPKFARHQQVHAKTHVRKAPVTNEDLATSPPPPSQPTRANGDTKYTTRLFGTTPAQKAVSVTQLVYPAEGPTGVTTSTPDDRPRAITLINPDDELTGITATPLIHFPDNAPTMYASSNGIPKITQDEIRRLKPVGIGRYDNVQAFVVGGAANPAVIADLKKLGLKYKEVTADDIPSLANKVDALYGSIQNPDDGYPVMNNTATGEGSSTADVVIGSMSQPGYILPATHWVSHMPTGLLWVDKDSVPQATIDALKRRNGKAQIYIYGGPGVVSSDVFRELGKYGNVSRITEDDNVAYNTPQPNTPPTTALAFSKMWDPVGMMGWNIVGPGHGFTIIRDTDWQGAVGSAILSHLGFHAPLVMTDSSKTLPSYLDGYFKEVAPAFLISPADGPYNMGYVIGDYGTVSWKQQTQVDHDFGMTNRRDPDQTTGGAYQPPE